LQKSAPVDRLREVRYDMSVLEQKRCASASTSDVVDVQRAEMNQRRNGREIITTLKTHKKQRVSQLITMNFLAYSGQHYRSTEA
jgi:hypothetical protein